MWMENKEWIEKWGKRKYFCFSLCLMRDRKMEEYGIEILPKFSLSKEYRTKILKMEKCGWKIENDRKIGRNKIFLFYFICIW